MDQKTSSSDGENDFLPAITFVAEVRSPQRLSPVMQRALPEAELCDRLLKAMERAALNSSHSMEALRIAVCDFTVALREQETSAEGVLISVKTVITQRVLPVSERRVSDWNNPRLREKISTWSIRDRVILRDAVCAFVAAERALGTPLKSVIRTLRRVLRNAEENAATTTDELARQLVDWCREFHGPVAGVTS